MVRHLRSFARVVCCSHRGKVPHVCAISTVQRRLSAVSRIALCARPPARHGGAMLRTCVFAGPPPAATTARLSTQAAPRHTILLVQATASPTTRSYYDFESKTGALDGVVRIFEEHLKVRNSWRGRTRMRCPRATWCGGGSSSRRRLQRRRAPRAPRRAASSQKQNPRAVNITYDVQDLFDFIDTLGDISCLMCVAALTQCVDVCLFACSEPQHSPFARAHTHAQSRPELGQVRAVPPRLYQAADVSVPQGRRGRRRTARRRRWRASAGLTHRTTRRGRRAILGRVAATRAFCQTVLLPGCGSLSAALRARDRK